MKNIAIEVQEAAGTNQYGDPYWTWANRSGAEVSVTQYLEVTIAGLTNNLTADETAGLTSALEAVHAWLVENDTRLPRGAAVPDADTLPMKYTKFDTPRWWWTRRFGAKVTITENGGVRIDGADDDLTAEETAGLIAALAAAHEWLDEHGPCLAPANKPTITQRGTTMKNIAATTTEIRQPDGTNLFGDPYWVWSPVREGARVTVSDEGKVYVTGADTGLDAYSAAALADALASAHAWIADNL